MQPDYKIVTLFALFVIFSAFAILLIFKPLREKKLITIVSSIFIVLTVVFFYKIWGGWGDFYAYKIAQESKKQALTLLKNMKSKDELLEKLVKHLEVHPESARGWYLLGRLYVSQNKSNEALNAFAKAYNIDSHDIAITVNYASLLIENGNELMGKEMLEKLLISNPTQQDALAILAMYAYKKQELTLAISYWQRLLSTLPSQSEEADAIRLAIAKAHVLKKSK